MLNLTNLSVTGIISQDLVEKSLKVYGEPLPLIRRAVNQQDPSTWPPFIEEEHERTCSVFSRLVTLSNGKNLDDCVLFFARHCMDNGRFHNQLSNIDKCLVDLAHIKKTDVNYKIISRYINARTLSYLINQQ